jgi:mono/diheme cytochrome c family protein
MPGFADKVSDEQAETLVNYLRAAWGGGQKPDVTAAAVRALR